MKSRPNTAELTGPVKAVASADEVKAAHHIRIEPARGWARLELHELWAFRDLLLTLALRDVKVRYKQTALGVLWVILQPLVSSFIFTIIFGNFANLPSDGKPYLLFVLAGILPWNLFASSLQRAGNSLVGSAGMISKVYFPRMIIPVASVAGVLIDFLVSLGVVAVLFLIYGWPVTVNVLALPVFVLVTMLLSLGAGLVVAALNVYYRDFGHALPFLIQVWMYASPVVYSTELVPEQFAALYALNPMVGVIEAFRWALLGSGEFPWLAVSLSVIVAILLFFGGALIFKRVESSFADVI